MRHFGYVNQKTPVLLLGFNKSNNSVMYLEVSQLSIDEMNWLSGFIARNYNERVLVPALNSETMRNGASAFQHFSRYAVTIESYNLHMTDKEQCIEWFKHPSSYVNRDVETHLADLVKDRLKKSLDSDEVVTETVTRAPVTEDHPLMETLKSVASDPRLKDMFAKANTKPAEDYSGEGTGEARVDHALEARLESIEKQLTQIAKEMKRMAVASEKKKKAVA